MFRDVYHKLFSDEFRIRLSVGYKKRQMTGWLSKHMNEFPPEEESELKGIIRFVRNHGFEMLPYEELLKYDAEKYEIIRDQDGYPYVIRNGKKLFFIKEWSEEKCVDYYRSICKEQDPVSPHCYINCDPEVRKPAPDSVIADIGAAEGVFALDVIEDIREAYLFECDEAWYVPLQKTFAPWKERVQIMKQYVGKTVDAQNHLTTLDEFFKDKEVRYIKADIEGAEKDMLLGGKEIFQNKIRQAAICAYHHQEDETVITGHLNNYGFTTEPNKGYVVMLGDKSIFYPPYLRRGVIYASRKKN